MPVRLRGDSRSLSAAAAWFPAVGGAVGALAGAVGYVAEPWLGASVAAVLVVAVLLGVTGALHQDGLADCADGLGIRNDRERRLTAMRDPSIGTFGALALLVWLLLLVAALAGLDREDALRAAVVVTVTSRWAALAHALTTRPARRDGLGAGFAVSRPAFFAASVTAVTVTLALVGIGRGLAVLGAAAMVALAVSRWSRATLGGRTGDTLGATTAIAEVTVAVLLLGLARHSGPLSFG